MTWLTKLILTATVVEAVIVVLALLLAGPPAMIAGLIGSAVAFGAQLTAILVLRPGMQAPGAEFMKRWTGGVAARLLSFVLLAVLILALRNVVPPLWLAAGYLLQMLTLLFAETVFLK